MRLLFFFFVQILIYSQLSFAGTEVRVKDPFPKFTLRRLFQATHASLEQYRGKIVIIDFWASWCEPCREEFSALNDLSKKYSKNGVYIIGINEDSEEVDARNFLKKSPAHFILLHDDGSKLSDDCNFQSMPLSFILDRQGVVQFMHGGYNGHNDPFVFDIELKTLLKL